MVSSYRSSESWKQKPVEFEKFTGSSNWCLSVNLCVESIKLVPENWWKEQKTIWDFSDKNIWQFTRKIFHGDHRVSVVTLLIIAVKWGENNYGIVTLHLLTTFLTTIWYDSWHQLPSLTRVSRNIQIFFNIVVRDMIDDHHDNDCVDDLDSPVPSVNMVNLREDQLQPTICFAINLA